MTQRDVAELYVCFPNCLIGSIFTPWPFLRFFIAKPSIASSSSSFSFLIQSFFFFFPLFKMRESAAK
jgi:hypothetical protein